MAQSALLVLGFTAAHGFVTTADAAPRGAPAGKQVTIELSEHKGRKKVSGSVVVLPIPEAVIAGDLPLPLHKQYWAKLTTRMRDSGPAPYCAFGVRRAAEETIELTVRCGERRHLAGGNTPLELDVRVVRPFSSRKRVEVARVDRPGGRRTTVTASVR